MKDMFSKRLDEIPSSGIREFFDLVLNAKDIISLGVGEPDFQTPWSVREKAIQAIEKGYTSYTSNKGMLECREEIANYLKNRFSAQYSAEEILLTFGVSEGVDIALRAILNPGDEVIIPEPSYVCYAPLVHLAGGECVGIDTSCTDFLPNVAEIKKKINNKTKAIILCSPSNPTGVVIPKEILMEIAELASEHQIWVIMDEVYAELSYTDFTSYASLENVKEHTILLSGFSKAFAMTGWRLGYICGPESLMSRVLKIHQYSALCAPIISQIAGLQAIKKCQKDVQKMRQSYKKRRDLYVTAMNALGLPTQLPGGAFYAFTDIRSTGMKSKEFAMALLESQRVAVVPGTAFGAAGEGYIRSCYAADESTLKEAVEKIGKFVKGLK